MKDSIVSMEYAEKAYKTYQQQNTMQSKTVLKIIEGGRHMFSKKHDKPAMEYIKEFGSAE